jgi:hypothetical protein
MDLVEGPRGSLRCWSPLLAVKRDEGRATLRTVSRGARKHRGTPYYSKPAAQICAHRRRYVRVGLHRRCFTRSAVLCQEAPSCQTTQAPLATVK